MTKVWLAPLLNEIADVAGLPAALLIAEVRGGSQVYIPARPASDHWLTQTVGPEAAEAICAHFRVDGTRGATLVIPAGPESGMNSIGRRVDTLLKQGVSVDEIARQVKVHRTTVFRRKANLNLPSNNDPNQPDLFGDTLSR